MDMLSLARSPPEAADLAAYILSLRKKYGCSTSVYRGQFGPGCLDDTTRVIASSLRSSQ
jgi:hypothetical protein